MSVATRTRHAARTIAAAVIMSMSLASCGLLSSETAKQTPQEALTAAAAAFRDTSGMKISLKTAALPANSSGVVEATGVVTKAPAFEGTLWAQVAGNVIEVPVVSADHIVYAKLPGGTNWSKIDPQKYNAFDPAGFLSAETGLSLLLSSMTNLKQGATLRGGVDNNELLTEYTGTVPGAVMKKVIPSATGDSFEATLSITDKNQLREGAFTGVFYANVPSLTYSVSATEYGRTDVIKAPTS